MNIGTTNSTRTSVFTHTHPTHTHTCTDTHAWPLLHIARPCPGRTGFSCARRHEPRTQHVSTSHFLLVLVCSAPKKKRCRLGILSILRLLILTRGATVMAEDRARLRQNGSFDQHRLCQLSQVGVWVECGARMQHAHLTRTTCGSHACPACLVQVVLFSILPPSMRAEATTQVGLCAMIDVTCVLRVCVCPLVMLGVACVYTLKAGLLLCVRSRTVLCLEQKAQLVCLELGFVCAHD